MKFKIIRNTLIPFKGFLAMTIWPFIFVRKDERDLTDKDINHESIHCYQQIEVLILSAIIIGILVFSIGISPWWFILAPFIYFIIYLIEYIIRYICCGNRKKAYRSIAVEQEAYGNEANFEYLKHRKLFAWVKYY